jgi:hypothetical protein
MKRHIVKLCVFIIAGAIVNVAAACGSSIFFGFADQLDSVRGFRVSETGTVNVEIYRGFSSMRVAFGVGPIGGETYSEGPDPESLVPHWTSIPSKWPEELQFLIRDDEARGVPFLALWSTTTEFYKRTDGTFRQIGTSGSIRLPLHEFDGGMGPIPRVLPLRPIWPGFEIDTVFYAAVLWVLVTAPGFIRRRIRIRRGLCPRCAYPIGTNAVCTECGKPVQPRRGAGTGQS